MKSIPKELLNIILDYDGRIKYKKGKYINVIHKNDLRYKIIEKLILKKLNILQKIEIRNNNSYCFDICFDYGAVGLFYDYNFSYKDIFEICYYDFRNGYNPIRVWF